MLFCIVELLFDIHFCRLVEKKGSNFLFVYWLFGFENNCIQHPSTSNRRQKSALECRSDYMQGRAGQLPGVFLVSSAFRSKHWLLVAVSVVAACGGWCIQEEKKSISAIFHCCCISVYCLL